MSLTPARMFISYRRSDTAAIARLIYDGLRHRFGHKHVFFDVDSIPIGVDFGHFIEEQISQCHVVLMVIGNVWSANGALFHEHDFVRIEIAKALELGLPIVPIFADDARAPAWEDVPELLRPALRRNGLRANASGRDFDNHLAEIAEHAERLARDYKKYARQKGMGSKTTAQVTQHEPIQRPGRLSAREQKPSENTQSPTEGAITGRASPFSDRFLNRYWLVFACGGAVTGMILAEATNKAWWEAVLATLGGFIVIPISIGLPVLLTLEMLFKRYR